MSLSINSASPEDTPAASPAAVPMPNVSAPSPAPEVIEPHDAGPTGDAPGEEEPAAQDPNTGPDSEAEAGEELPPDPSDDKTDPIGQEPMVSSAEQADSATPPAAETEIPAAASGVVSADTAAPVGAAPAADVVAPAASFLDKVGASADEARHALLGITSFPQEVKDFILKTLDEGSHQTKGLISEVLSYVKKMGPHAPVTGKEIDNHQVGLFTQLISAIEHPGDDFRAMMNCLLAIIHQHKADGAFSLRLYARGMQSMPLSRQHRDTFQALINLFRTTSGGDTRKEALKQVDLARSVTGLHPTAQDRLRNFYHV